MTASATVIEVSPVYNFSRLRIKDLGKKGYFRIRMGRYKGSNRWGIQAYLFRKTAVRLLEDEVDRKGRDILYVSEGNRKYVEILREIKEKYGLNYVILYRGKIIE